MFGGEGTHRDASFLVVEVSSERGVSGWWVGECLLVQAGEFESDVWWHVLHGCDGRGVVRMETRECVDVSLVFPWSVLDNEGEFFKL